MKPKKKFLFVTFTPEERIAVGEQASKISADIDFIESEKKRVNMLREDLSAQLKRYQENGEFRDVEIREQMNTPRVGMKTVVRLDTGEIVGEEPMTTEDTQLAMEFDNKRGYDTIDISDGDGNVIASNLTRIPAAK